MDVIQKAAHFIQQGKLVIFPTETVYGLGADGLNIAACKKILDFVKPHCALLKNLVGVLTPFTLSFQSDF